MIGFPKRSLNAPRSLGGLFGQDTDLEPGEGLLARGLARVGADELGVVTLARVLRTVHDTVTMTWFGPVVAPVQGELTDERRGAALAVAGAGRLGTIGRARFVALVRVADLIAAARARAVVARARIFGDPADAVAALVGTVLGAVTCVLVCVANAVATRGRTVSDARISGLSRTADAVAACCGTVAAAVPRVLGLTTVTVATLLGAVGHALLARLALRRVARAVATLSRTDAAVAGT